MDDTKARLIEAAGEEFGERGFLAATVRAICARAGANLAAVNYHFGDKDRLYEQTLLAAFRACAAGQQEPAPIGADPAARLHSYLRQFLQHFLAVGQRDDDWQHKMMLRELIRPTKAVDVLVREMIRPRFETLSAIVRELRPDLEGRALFATVFSVVGQCMFYRFARGIAERLVGPTSFATLDLDFLTDHITSFTLRALEAGAPAGVGEKGGAPWPGSR
jgi:TetR/AcrR family transcriptional regulator, regulator of cefoperazone and chloramphenicol sensitivity